MKTILIAAMLAALSVPALAYTCTHDVGPDNGNKVTCEQAQADLRNGMTKLDRDHDGYACDRQCGD